MAIPGPRFSCGLGVSTGLLQERLLQFQHENVPVKSWLNSWSTSSQPDFVCALDKEKQYEIARARLCTQSCSKVGQLVNSAPTPRPLRTCRGLPCSSPLSTPKRFTILDSVPPSLSVLTPLIPCRSEMHKTTTPFEGVFLMEPFD